MASFFVYFFVSANEDIYDNQIEVTNELTTTQRSSGGFGSTGY